MPVLDRYILFSFLRTFFSFFFILMLIFVVQTVWVFIDEFAGKGLDITVLLRFLLYYSPKLIPLVLPLTVLLASIMTSGSLAEHYEFAALKSAGISLTRAMRSVFVVSLLLSGIGFYVGNTVVYSGVTGSNDSSIGNGATFDITRASWLPKFAEILTKHFPSSSAPNV